MKTFETMNLQLFADAGTLVNATGNYVNAYDGTPTAFSGVNTLASTLKTFYDTELLENARITMIYSQFAKKQPLPANHGKTVEWRKWNTFARAAKLTEGVIPTGQKFGQSAKTASISQYGTYAAISDQLELHAYDPVILGATEEMGASMAETQEILIRDALLTGTNVLYCDNIKDDGTVVSTPTSCATMAAGGQTASADNGWALLTPDMVAKAVTKMKKDRVPTINGKYVAVIHPSVADALLQPQQQRIHHERHMVGRHHDRRPVDGGEPSHRGIVPVGDARDERDGARISRRRRQPQRDHLGGGVYQRDDAQLNGHLADGDARPDRAGVCPDDEQILHRDGR